MTSRVLAFGPPPNLSSGDRYLGFISMAFLLWLLLFEVRHYLKTDENPPKMESLPQRSRIVLIISAVAVHLLIIGAVWALWHISGFEYRTVFALVLTAANVCCMTLDCYKLHRYGAAVPRPRSKRVTHFWVACNLVEIILIILIAFG